jgi:Family of unknown function (DUF6416)
VCIACVLNSAARQPADVSASSPGVLAGWSAADAAKAATVYRQLPRWSRRLFDLLSSAPGRRFPRSAAQASLAAAGDGPFGVDEACEWAAAFCAASGRPLPVQRETLPSGGTVYWMEQPAAKLFQHMIIHSPG